MPAHFRNIATAASFLVLVGCAATPQQRSDEQPVANCFNRCSMEFAECTNRHAGDFSDCSRVQNRCQQACEAQRMEEREDDEEVIVEDRPAIEGMEGPAEAAPEIDSEAAPEAIDDEDEAPQP